MVGGPAQVQSHEEKNPAISLPQKIGSQISIFLLVRLLPACLAGWRRFSFFLRFAPLAKNRAAQRTLVKAAPQPTSQKELRRK
jgi:hypothetical protein